MENIPYYVSTTFIACVLATLGFLYFAVWVAGRKTNIPIIVITLLCSWLFFITVLTVEGVFLNFETKPPRLFYPLLVMLLLIISSLSFPDGRRFIAAMPITTLTYVHIVRVPVEIVLWWLYVSGAVSEAMTFEGINYDILSGISAPFAGLFLVGMKSKSNFAAIVWNVLALGLLINIVLRAVQASPYFYDPAVYDQPNLAVFYFPYILLPAFVVPAIIFCHVASLYKLIFVKEPGE